MARDVILQDCAKIDISFKPGDDMSFDIEFPFDVIDYEIEISLGDTPFTVVEIDSKTIRCSLDEIQTTQIKDRAKFLLRLTKDDYTRTYNDGRYRLI
jgi:hypothetical protein